MHKYKPKITAHKKIFAHKAPMLNKNIIKQI